MAKTDRLYVRIDPETKAKAAVVFESSGISLSKAITDFLNLCVNTGGIPFPMHTTTENFAKNTLYKNMKKM